METKCDEAPAPFEFESVRMHQSGAGQVAGVAVRAAHVGGGGRQGRGAELHDAGFGEPQAAGALKCIKFCKNVSIYAISKGRSRGDERGRMGRALPARRESPQGGRTEVSETEKQRRVMGNRRDGAAPGHGSIPPMTQLATSEQGSVPAGGLSAVVGCQAPVAQGFADCSMSGPDG